MEDKILRKVRALLAQAEDPAATPEEAETFSAKAEELIARYAIDAALLEAKSQHRGKPTVRKFEKVEGYAKAKAHLLAGIAKAHGCRIIQHSDKTLTVIGFQSDLDVVEILYTSLLVQASHASVASHRTDRSFRTSFWYGFAHRVYQRLEETRRVVVQEAVEETHSASTALVLRDREEEVDAYQRELFPNLRKATGARIGSRDGFGSGVSAANRANIGTSSLGGGHRALA